MNAPIQNFRRRCSRGFTIIELLVVVVITGILAGTGLANYISAQSKSKVAQTKANMHTIQLAAESYGSDTAGWYPSTAADLAPYLPGGSNTPGGAAGAWPVNPFSTSGQSDPPDDRSNITNVVAARSQAAGSLHDTPGKVVYDHGLDTHAYAIWGCNDNGNSIAGASGKQLVLANQ